MQNSSILANTVIDQNISTTEKQFTLKPDTIQWIQWTGNVYFNKKYWEQWPE